MIGLAVYAWLTAESGVTDLIGQRIFPNKARPGTTFPYLTYQEITGRRAITLKLPSNYDTALVQFDLWDNNSDGYEKLIALTQAILGTRASPKLNGYTGTIGGIYIFCARLEGPPQDLHQSDQTGGELGVYHRSFDILFQYKGG